MNKWEAADEYAKDNGYEFQVWTEKTLNSMGIKANLQNLLKRKK